MDNKNLSLGAVASCFLASLTPEAKGASQQEIYKFVRWFGGGRPFVGLNAAEIANYAEQLSFSDTDYIRKLDLARAFLVYARKKEWGRANLAIHLKARKGKTRPQPAARQDLPETIFLTPQGYTELKAELVALHEKRSEAIDEIRKAAADKDFRENMPLQAARERRGHLEGRIMELETTLKSAVVIDEKQKSALRMGIGDSVVLEDLDSGEEMRYMLVSRSEVDPSRGRISDASPIGKAVLGRMQGEIVEIIAPAGRLRYRIKQIER